MKFLFWFLFKTERFEDYARRKWGTDRPMFPGEADVEEY